MRAELVAVMRCVCATQRDQQCVMDLAAHPRNPRENKLPAACSAGCCFPCSPACTSMLCSSACRERWGAMTMGWRGVLRPMLRSVFERWDWAARPLEAAGRPCIVLLLCKGARQRLLNNQRRSLGGCKPAVSTLLTLVCLVLRAGEKCGMVGPGDSLVSRVLEEHAQICAGAHPVAVIQALTCSIAFARSRWDASHQVDMGLPRPLW